MRLARARFHNFQGRSQALRTFSNVTDGFAGQRLTRARANCGGCCYSHWSAEGIELELHLLVDTHTEWLRSLEGNHESVGHWLSQLRTGVRTAVHLDRHSGVGGDRNRIIAFQYLMLHSATSNRIMVGIPTFYS